MRKFFALMIALVLLLSMSLSASATPFYLESAGVTIEVPVGLTGEDASGDDYAALHILVDDNPNLSYVYVVSYDETLEDRWMEDLTDEEGEALLAGIAASLENPSFDGVEMDGISVLIAANEDGSQLHYFTLLGGWICDVAAVRTDGAALSKDEIQMAANLLMSIEFDEG